MADKKRYKGIKTSSLNRRLKALEKEFGEESSVLKAAKAWIKFRVDTVALDDNGYIKMDVEEVGGKRWAHVDDAIPTVDKALRREFKEAPEKARGFIGPSILPEKYKDVKNNPQARAYLKSRANITADLLLNAGDAKDETDYPNQPQAMSYYLELEENGWLSSVLNWLDKVNTLVQDYLIWASQQAEDDYNLF